ncbi:hypothetical protein S83_069607 [Arachis hypogaea]
MREDTLVIGENHGTDALSIQAHYPGLPFPTSAIILFLSSKKHSRLAPPPSSPNHSSCVAVVTPQPCGPLFIH